LKEEELTVEIMEKPAVFLSGKGGAPQKERRVDVKIEGLSATTP